MRIDPLRSPPRPTNPRPAASAPAVPPLDPPVVRAGFHGLRAVPDSSLYDCQSAAMSGMLVFPTTMAPAARSRATATASSDGTYDTRDADPAVVRRPAVAKTSLTTSGTP